MTILQSPCSIKICRIQGSLIISSHRLVYQIQGGNVFVMGFVCFADRIFLFQVNMSPIIITHLACFHFSIYEF